MTFLWIFSLLNPKSCFSSQLILYRLQIKFVTSAVLAEENEGDEIDLLLLWNNILLHRTLFPVSDNSRSEVNTVHCINFLLFPVVEDGTLKAVGCGASVPQRAAGCSALLLQPEHPDKHFGLESWQRMQLHPSPGSLSLSLWHINPPQLLHSPRAESSSSKPPFHRGSHHTGAWRVLAGCKFVDCGALWLVNVLGSWAAWSGFLMGTNQSRGKQGAVREERDGELERDRAGDGWSHSCDIQYTLLLLYYKHLAQTNALENSRAAVNPAFMQVVTQRILIQTNGQLDMSNLDQHRWAEPIMIWRRLQRLHSILPSSILNHTCDFLFQFVHLSSCSSKDTAADDITSLSECL